MVTGKLHECIYELEWRMIWYFGIYKEVDDGGTNNSDGWSSFLAGELVEESEVKMEVSALIKVLCGNIGVIG